MKILVFGFLGIFLLGCQSAPLRYAEQSEGQWTAKALVKNKKDSKSAVVGMDINAVQGKKIRIDVTAALGHPVASMVMQEKQLTYVLMEKKQYYQGNATEDALARVINIPVNPHLLYNLFFDLPVTEKSWACTQDSKGFLTECKQAKNNLLLRWADRHGRRKVLYIDHPDGSLQINVNTFQPKVEGRAGLFELKPPASFRQIR